MVKVFLPQNNVGLVQQSPAGQQLGHRLLYLVSVFQTSVLQIDKMDLCPFDAWDVCGTWVEKHAFNRPLHHKLLKERFPLCGEQMSTRETFHCLLAQIDNQPITEVGAFRHEDADPEWGKEQDLSDFEIDKDGSWC